MFVFGLLTLFGDVTEVGAMAGPSPGLLTLLGDVTEVRGMTGPSPGLLTLLGDGLPTDPGLPIAIAVLAGAFWPRAFVTLPPEA
jgi:hypothetical protein